LYFKIEHQILHFTIHFTLGFACLIAGVTSAAAESVAYNSTLDVSYATESNSDSDLQSLDVYWQDKKQKLPVIVYVHGGGWAFGDKSDVHQKPDYFLSQGLAVVSMNYRLRWDNTVLDQVEDVVKVIQWVQKNATTYGLDPNSIILMGHAAGAHLVSLAATNQSYLKSAGLDLQAIRAVVAIDTVSFDINRLMIELGSFIERRQHRLVFGGDEEVWRQSSPVHHVTKGKHIPAFAILYVASGEGTRLQAMAFAKKLGSAEVETIVIPGNEKTSESIDEELGSEGDISTQALMAFIRAKI
jgi:arylformamidase